MKRKVCLLILVLVIVLAACGKKQDNPITSEQDVESVVIEETNAPETLQTEAAVVATIAVEQVELPSGEGTGTIDEISFESDEDRKGIDAIESVVDSNEQNVGPTAPAEEIKNEGCGCVYAEYLAKSPAEQEDYMNTFASPIDFITWCKTAEAEHSSHVTVIEASGSELNIGDYIK